MNTFLLGNLLARLDWDPLVDTDTGLPGHLLAHLEWFLGTFPLGYLVTDLLGNLHTNLPWHIIAHGVAELALLGLANIGALLIRLLSAGAGDGNPDLVIALALDRKSTRLNSSHSQQSRMPSSA